jgi:hypothetical protein
LHFLSAAPQAGSSQRIEMENLGSDVLKAVYRDGWLYLMTNDTIGNCDDHPTNYISRASTGRRLSKQYLAHLVSTVVLVEVTC